MNLEQIQIALFNLYDIHKSLDKKVLRQPIYESSFDETVGGLLEDVIDFLKDLEAEAEEESA